MYWPPHTYITFLLLVQIIFRIVAGSSFLHGVFVGLFPIITLLAEKLRDLETQTLECTQTCKTISIFFTPDFIDFFHPQNVAMFRFTWGRGDRQPVETDFPWIAWCRSARGHWATRGEISSHLDIYGLRNLWAYFLWVGGGFCSAIFPPCILIFLAPKCWK